MLRHLTIRNFALVEQLELEFLPGMTVLTGETGAGKSILLDALGLVLGDRADSGMVRSGQARADISAGFAIDPLPTVQAWLSERALDTDGECILRRTISADGGSRGFINGQPATLQSMRELGEQLVDIHGQHAHQSLLKRDMQRRLLDDFAGHQKLLEQVHAAWQRWHGLRQELDHLGRAAAERESRLELLRYQVGELENLGLAEGEAEALATEHQRLANAERLQQGAQQALQTLYENDLALAPALTRVLGDLQALQAIDNTLSATCELLDGAVIQLDEAISELRHYLDRGELDPQRLDWLDLRLGIITDLARKHRCADHELPALLMQLQTELSGLEQADQRLDGLQEEIDRALDDYRQRAARLTASRQQAASALAEQVSANMAELGMREGRFAVALENLPADQPAAHGLERVELQVSANPGLPLKPLAKVASGGELSRISLAIQVIIADRGQIPTLIFDEVDVGVGGGVAEMVGRQLRSLGGSHQVLCVTHQPQVAAQGHQHLQVSKHSGGGSTSSTVQPLDEDARVEEIARMLGGMTITDQTLSHAREMLDTAAIAGITAETAGQKNRRQARKKAVGTDSGRATDIKTDAGKTRRKKT